MQKSERFLLSRELPYCPGCSHRIVNLGLAEALTEMGLVPKGVIVVSDIGCVGLLDKYFRCHTVHALHGRSTAIGAGLRLASPSRPPYIIVAIGDGGAIIGLIHLVEAARYDLDITVLIHNNFLYGMTGGQHSGLTPAGFKTRTTPEGSPVHGLKILDILRDSGATFLAREFAQSKGLKSIIAEGIKHQGFSAIEVLELCTAYALPWNRLTGKRLVELAKTEGWETGILLKKRETHPIIELSRDADLRDQEIKPEFKCNIKTERTIFLAGSAGEGVQSAARWFTVVLNLCGLFTSQKNDNPVTVGTGYSTSEIKISPNPIEYTGIETPEVVVITSEDGLKEVYSYMEMWEKKAPMIVIDEGLTREFGGINVRPFPLREGGKRTIPNILGLIIASKIANFGIPEEAFIEAASYTKYPEIIKRALELARGLES